MSNPDSLKIWGMDQEHRYCNHSMFFEEAHEMSRPGYTKEESKTMTQ